MAICCTAIRKTNGNLLYDSGNLNQLSITTLRGWKQWEVAWRFKKNPLLLLLSRFSRVRLCATPLTAAHQAPLSLGFSRQEHWSLQKVLCRYCSTQCPRPCNRPPLTHASTGDSWTLYTWTSPDGQYPNQIDYILCSQRWRSSIQSAKTGLGSHCGSDGKASACNEGDPGSIPGSGRSPGEGNGIK